MWALVPIIISLLNIAVSTTSPIDHNEMLFRQGDFSPSRDFPDLKTLSARLKQTEINDANDQRPEWNINDDTYDINSRKIVPIGTIDDDMYEDVDHSQIDEPNETEIMELTHFLSTILKEPIWMSPVAIVEDPIDNTEDDFVESDNRKLSKRSRYYRRYPWKRQNRLKNALDYESTYLCTPSRNDVLQLLLALHEVRQGDKSRTVHFCNRKRPVGTVFTNIRFLGRRK